MGPALGHDSTPRDPEYLDKLWVGSQAKRLRVRVQQTQGCVVAVPFFFPAHRCTTSATSPLGRGGVPQDRAQKPVG